VAVSQLKSNLGFPRLGLAPTSCARKTLCEIRAHSQPPVLKRGVVALPIAFLDVGSPHNIQRRKMAKGSQALCYLSAGGGWVESVLLQFADVPTRLHLVRPLTGSRAKLGARAFLQCGSAARFVFKIARLYAWCFQKARTIHRVREPTMEVTPRANVHQDCFPCSSRPDNCQVHVMYPYRREFLLYKVVFFPHFLKVFRPANLRAPPELNEDQP